jgi:uncharacterized membrane protein
MMRDLGIREVLRSLPPIPWHKISWLWVMAAVSLAGIIHVVAVLVLPYVAERDGWARLSTVSPVNQMTVLNPSGNGKIPLPFMAPDVVYATCRFDLSEKNVAVKMNFLDPTWMLAVYTRYGENFYVMFGADAKVKDARLLLVPQERLAQETVSDQNEEGDDQVLVISPTLTGVVMIQAPVRGDVFMPATGEALKSAVCEPQKPTDARVLAKAPEPPPPPENKRKPRRRGRSGD